MFEDFIELVKQIRRSEGFKNALNSPSRAMLASGEKPVHIYITAAETHTLIHNRSCFRPVSTPAQNSVGADNVRAVDSFRHCGARPESAP